MQPGRPCRDHWLLEAGLTFLNHGSFGATPKVVLAAQQAWRDRLERQPLRFMSREGPASLRLAASELAQFLGTTGENLVFVDNATTGVNAVLRSFSWQKGDDIVVTNHTYGAIHKAVAYAAQTYGLRVIEAPIPFPIAAETEVIAALEAVLSPQTRLVVLDHVTSATALVMPLEALIALCHQRGIPVLVDGAHAPGMVPLNLEALGADWYTGNCHKWLFAPKGCGFLWCQPLRQQELHPLVISWGWGDGYQAAFDWPGTRDMTPWLAVTAALDFYRSWGSAWLPAHNHDLAVQAGLTLAKSWGVSRPAPPALLGSMATIPLPGDPQPATLATATALHDILLEIFQIEVPVIAFGGHLWIRVSAQVYNELADYELLGAVMAKALAQAGVADSER